MSVQVHLVRMAPPVMMVLTGTHVTVSQDGQELSVKPVSIIRDVGERFRPVAKLDFRGVHNLRKWTFWT